MRIALTLETNLGGERNGWINDFSNQLEIFFAEKNYGDNLKEFLIGIIVVSPEFDFFFKVRRPKYRQGKKELSTNGVKYEIEDIATYDVKLDFSKYSLYQKDEFILKLKSEIFSSIQFLKQIKKLKEFDFKAFESDLRNSLKYKITNANHT